MARTCGRPLVTGRLTMTESIVFATLLGVSGFVMLWMLVNPLTAVLTQFTLIGYAGVYTLYLKRATQQNIVTGGAAGGAPPLLGWVAMQGEVHVPALGRTGLVQGRSVLVRLDIGGGRCMTK